MNARDALISKGLPTRCRFCNSAWYDQINENHKQQCPVPQLIESWNAMSKVCDAARKSDISFDGPDEQVNAGHSLLEALTELDKLNQKDK